MINTRCCVCAARSVASRAIEVAMHVATEAGTVGFRSGNLYILVDGFIALYYFLATLIKDDCK
jgi:hypothetical protein